MARAGRILGLIALALAAAMATAAVALTMIDWRAKLESTLADSLGRRTTIASLDLGWQRGPVLLMRGVTIANSDGGSEPIMLRVAGLDAHIDWAPLLRGVLQYRQLRVDGLDLLLERLPGGPNWRFAGGSGGSIGHIALVPKDRTQFPTLLDARVRDSRVRYRATSGKLLAVGLGDLMIAAAADDQPARLQLSGSYDSTQGTMSVSGASFADMRRADMPYQATVEMDLARSRLDFSGTLMNPLDVDGIEGTLTARSEQLGALLTAFGAAMAAPFPVQLEGILLRNGDSWRLNGALGTLARSGFAGTLALDEGARGMPDAVASTLAFDALDLNLLLGRGGSGGDPSLRLDPQATRVTADLTARTLTYRSTQLGAVILRFDLRGPAAMLHEASFAAAGGRVKASATLAGDGHLVGEAAMAGVDLATIAGQAGAGKGDIAGRADGRLSIDITGPRLMAALRSGRIQAVLAMSNGQIARAILEQASADIRALLRDADGSVRVACMLAVADLRNGVGRVHPLRLRSQDGTLSGTGVLDLPRQAVDITFHADNTGFFALDVPIRVAGPISGPSIGPAPSSAVDALKRMEGAGVPADLAPPLRELAAANACAR